MPKKWMWVHPSAAAAGEGVEDITLIIRAHPMPFPFLTNPNRIL